MKIIHADINEAKIFGDLYIPDESILKDRVLIIIGGSDGYIVWHKNSQKYFVKIISRLLHLHTRI